MKATLYTDDLSEAPVELVAVGVFSDEPDRGLAYAHLNQGLDGALERACRDERFKGEPGQTVVFNANGGGPRRILVYGYGERSEYGPEAARRFAGAATRLARKVQAKSCGVQLTIPDVPAPVPEVLALMQALAEGAVLGNYRYDEFKKKDEKQVTLKELRVALVAEDVPGVKGVELRAALQKGQTLGRAACTARDLVNAPPNVLFPAALADRARKAAKASELDCKILTARDLEKQGMNLHLGVGKGSAHEPRLIHLSYTPQKSTKNQGTIALVGKGLTFDAGGLSLKTSEGMMEMKIDMGGGAAVLGAMVALAELKPKCVVHGIIGAAENMPDGGAIRPGDVLVSKKGITVEVLNTDAEGRLVLADALAYAQAQKPSEIIDLATLTGACMVALGRSIAGAFISDEDLAKRLAEAWQQSGEKFWRMPLDPELKELLKSEVADIKNIGERWGGAITAALFLREFVDPDIPWAHLDIAGPVFAHKESGHTPKGGTGFGVRTLVEYVLARGS